MVIHKICYKWIENWNKNIESTDKNGECQNGNGWFPWHFGPKAGKRSADPFQRSPGREHQQHHPPQQPGWHHTPNKSSCQLDYLRHLVLTNFFNRNYTIFLLNFLIFVHKNLCCQFGKAFEPQTLCIRHRQMRQLFHFAEAKWQMAYSSTIEFYVKLCFLRWLR